MSTARAHACYHVIANWRGIPFHCFDLDRHLTGLQGQNGSGKTTVMAAYITAIVPNQRLLNFPNITAGGHTKGDPGLWGRLNDGPAYTLLAWRTPVGRLIWAGVALERRSSPQIEMKPFIVEDLPEGIDAWDAFLVMHGSATRVPPLPQLREHLKLLGANIVTHASIGSYMRTLYEHGVTPLPMGSHEEQERFYRLLASSMAGSSLGSLARTGLRDYLLSEDATLERRITYMRESLERCRHTQRELEQANAAHAEIRGYYEAAWGMAASAWFGAMARHEQAANLWREQFQVMRSQRGRVWALGREIVRLETAHEELKDKLERAREAESQARQAHEKAQQARGLRWQLEAARTDLTQKSAVRADAHCQEQEAGRLAREAEQTSRHAHEEFMRIADELADLNKAVEGLFTRVKELHRAREALETVRTLFPGKEIRESEAAALHQEINPQYEALTRQENEVLTELHTFEQHRQSFEELMKLVRDIATADGETVPEPEEAGHWAQRLEVKLRETRFLAARQNEILAELAKARDESLRQQRVRRLGHVLGIDSHEALQKALKRVIATLDRIEQEQHQHRLAMEKLQQEKAELAQQLPPQKEAVRRHAQARDCRAALQQHGSPLAQAETRDALQEALVEAGQVSSTLERQRHDMTGQLSQVKKRIASLSQPSGTLFDVRLGEVAGHLDGRLLAHEFDDLTLEEAARVEARLGPWLQAIMVESPQVAALQAAELEDRPDTLLLVSRQGNGVACETRTLGDSELVHEREDGDFQGLRLTRRPQRPLLGRRAREMEMARLNEEAAALEKWLDELREQVRQHERLMEVAREWLALGPGAWGEDPEPAYRAALERDRQLERSLTETRRALGRLERERSEAWRQKQRLGEIEPESRLLDAPHWDEEARRLEGERSAAEAACRWLELHGEKARIVSERQSTLARVPDETRRRTLGDELGRLRTDREQMGRQLGALAELRGLLHAFAYAEDEKAYLRQSSLVESLQARCEPARRRRDEADTRKDATTQAAKEATEKYQACNAAYQSAHAEFERREVALQATGLGGTDLECDLARKAFEDATRMSAESEQQERQCDRQLAAAQRDLSNENDKLIERRVALRERSDTLHNERRMRGELRKLAQELGIERQLQSEEERLHDMMGGNPIQAFQESRNHGARLLERLAKTDIHAEVGTLLGQPGDEARRAERTLRAWERVHRYIEQRIPRNLATSDDPREALAQMQQKIADLRCALDEEEKLLRRRSGDISGAVQSRLRSAGALIHKLNEELGKVSFGSIRGVHIRHERPDSMVRMLEALQEQGSGSLFDPEMPLEAALQKMYERIGGGRIAGSQLLDYRNYLSLRLQVRRIDGGWDNAEGVSTGEAIGVGAAVLVMILRTWNEEAKRLSGAGAGRSMQQIFLDEANRLDQDALDTLADFCIRMDVQALVAAPGLDRPRRSTVFVMERSFVDRQEQVTIRGQRITA